MNKKNTKKLSITTELLNFAIFTELPRQDLLLVQGPHIKICMNKCIKCLFMINLKVLNIEKNYKTLN